MQNLNSPAIRSQLASERAERALSPDYRVESDAGPWLPWLAMSSLVLTVAFVAYLSTLSF